MLRFGTLHFVSLLCGLLLWLQTGQAISDETELLPEDQAFAFQAELLPGNQLEVSWTIAEGYYMYRDKIEYRISGENALTSPLQLPTGKQKFDELFGDVEVYTGVFKMMLPLKHDGIFTLIADGQGCNEPVGVCYPPITHEIAFDPATAGNVAGGLQPPLESNAVGGFGRVGEDSALVAAIISDSGSSGPSMQSSSSRIPEPATGPPQPETESETEITQQVDSIEQLRDLLASGFEQPEYLAVDEAFKLSVDQVDSETLQANFEIAPGYYLYRDKISFAGTGNAGIKQASLPAGEVKEDEYFGRSVVFRESFQFPLYLERAETSSRQVVMQANYQGCAEQGICYPPVTKSFTIDLPGLITVAEAQVSDAAAVTSRPNVTDAPVDTAAFISLLLGAFAAGLLLTFTPCVLPMIPILSGVIAGQGDRLTRSRGGVLALIYVLGTAATYAAMGALAGATGEQLQAYFQNIWAIGIFAGIFVVMALAMFGVFELQMPAAIQSRLQSSTGKMSGSIPLVFILGLVSALIVGACVSPVLISFLGLAVSRADPVLGAQMMFVMAMGMGLPLIALGFGAGYILPRAGAWMDSVKYFFGIMLIGVAIYLLGVLPQVPVLLLWGVFFIIVSTYLGATQSLPEGSSGWHRLGKGFGTVLLVWGIAALLGGFYGERDIFKPLPATLFQVSGGQSAPGQQGQHLFIQIADLGALDQQFSRAETENKRILIDFYADWCVDCIKMEKSTFQNQSVVDVLSERYIALQVDVTDPNDESTKAIKKKFGVFGPPAVLFFDANGKPLDLKNFYGYQNPEQFLSLISN
ncbi:MAG: protein-disulfide reductase DsbD [bacterium]